MPRARALTAPLSIRAYFDFSCPWSYLGRARLHRALKLARVKAQIEWIPFELYAHHVSHAREKEKIVGHEHLNQVYAHLHAVGAKENLIILHPQYEASSRRALTGFLFAREKGVEEKYLDELFAQSFEHTANIASLVLLRRVAIKLGWDPEAFISFVEQPVHQQRVVNATVQAKREGVRGLPTYWVHHLPITGALEVQDLVHILHSLTSPVLPAFMVEKKRVVKAKKKSKPARKRKYSSVRKSKKRKSS